jgi:hypothetical protein
MVCALGLAALLVPAGAGAAEAGTPAAPIAAAPPAPGEAQPAASPAPATERVLSNERTQTTWAHPELEGGIYARPAPHARRLARVHLFTEDGFQEVYLLLREQTDAQGRAWVKIRIPGRPNGREGWMLRELLGPFQQTRWQLVVNLSTHRMTVFYDGRLRRVFPVGVGKPSTPTPAGHFWIRERFRLTSRSNPYWPYALGTSDYSTLSEWPGGGVIGIHGDFGQPQLIPGAPSHGCVRMHDADIGWLAPHITLGTPVDIVRG